MNKFIQFATLSLIALMMGAVPSAQAEELNLDFTIVNKTGWSIKEIYVAPSSSENWEENILKEPLLDDETLDVTFEPSEKSKKWDLRIVWVDEGSPVVWKNYDLSEISKITLFYNAKTDVTSAKTE